MIDMWTCSWINVFSIRSRASWNKAELQITCHLRISFKDFESLVSELWKSLCRVCHSMKSFNELKLCTITKWSCLRVSFSTNVSRRRTVSGSGNPVLYILLYNVCYYLWLYYMWLFPRFVNLLLILVFVNNKLFIPS